MYDTSIPEVLPDQRIRKTTLTYMYTHATYLFSMGISVKITKSYKLGSRWKKSIIRLFITDTNVALIMF